MFAPHAPHVPLSTAHRPAAGIVLLAVALLASLLLGPAPASASLIGLPERSTTTTIGTSVRGRPIVAVHRYRLGAEPARRLLVIGNLHGDEKAGLRVIARLRALPLPAEVDLWLIPTANPDGTAANRRGNAHGVDLNRNFPDDWRRLRGKYTSGSRPASEPETRALLAFTRTLRPDRTVIFHQPLYGIDVSGGRSAAYGRALARAMKLPTKRFRCNSACHGTYTSWSNTTLPGIAVTAEFGTTASAAQIDRAARAVLSVRG